MGRVLRSHLPGAPFHITARTQGREPLFVDLEQAIVRLILEHAAYADVSVHAYAVMPNHLHLVLTQGARPLASFMQPLLRRVALLVMGSKAREGHIFERRYFDLPCSDADHLRNAIAYTHLNGWRAGLCSGAADFAACSHMRMCAAPESASTFSRLQLGMECSLRLFACAATQPLNECRIDYLRFLEWRMAMDRHLAEGGSVRDGDAPRAPWCRGGDEYWERHFAGYAPAHAERRAVRRLPDLNDLAQEAIAELAPGMDIRLLRSGDRARAVVRVRRHVTVHALATGHRRRILARFLNVSETTISSIATRAAAD